MLGVLLLVTAAWHQATAAQFETRSIGNFLNTTKILATFVLYTNCFQIRGVRRINAGKA